MPQLLYENVVCRFLVQFQCSLFLVDTQGDPPLVGAIMLDGNEGYHSCYKFPEPRVSKTYWIGQYVGQVLCGSGGNRESSRTMSQSRQTMHILSGEEVDNALRIFDALSNVAWCADLLKKLKILQQWREVRNEQRSEKRDALGAILDSSETRASLFELRWAYELHQLAIETRYECPSLGKGSVDFWINTPTPWLLELVSSMSSSRADDSIKLDEYQLERGVKVLVSEIRSDAADDQVSPQYEVNRLQGLILEKVGSRKGEPRKFPAPTSNAYHAIVVDSRGFEGGFEPDPAYLFQLFYGPRELAVRGMSFMTLSFRGSPLFGIFDEGGVGSQIDLLQRRVHVVAVCGERQIAAGKLAESTRLFINPFLADAEQAAAAFPLKCETYRRGYRHYVGEKQP